MSVLRGASLNLIGLGLPLVAAIVTVPYLVHSLGPSDFGLLTLIWAVTSYFGLFDLGLGRALTREISVLVSRGRANDAGPWIATTVVSVTVIGLVVGVLLVAGEHVLVSTLAGLRDLDATLGALRWVALALPFVLMTSALRGTLEAWLLFGPLNAIRIPMGLLTFIGPAATVALGYDRIDHIAAVLAVGRIVAAALHAVIVLGTPQGRSLTYQFRSTILKPLLVSGGWFSVSSMVSPLMGYVDRFVLAAVGTTSMVAYYTTPQEIVTKLWIVPSALTAVLFPTFGRLIGDELATRATYRASVVLIFCALLPVTLSMYGFAPTILTAWIGAGFALDSAPALQMFAVGILFNCLAFVPLSFLQASGMNRLSALLQVLELTFFAPIIALSAWYGGVEGAATAWAGRALFDSAVLFMLAARHGQTVPRTTLGTGLLTWLSSTLVLTWANGQISAIIVAVSCLLAGVFGIRAARSLGP